MPTIPPSTVPPTAPPTTVPPLGTVAKWVQSPELSDPGIAIRVDQVGSSHILADDFPCDTTGRLVTITIWGSFKGDVGADATFDLAIHPDIPASPSTTVPGTTVPPSFSKPNTDVAPLWTMSFSPGSYTIVPVATFTDWWWDPAAPLGAGNPSLITGTTIDYKITFDIDPGVAFLQTGTPSEPMIYWLSVSAATLADDEFGWKTRLVSEGTFGDNAVWAPSTVPPPSSAWGEMTYPVGHPLAGSALDTAFALETLPEVVTTVPPTTAPPPIPSPEKGYTVVAGAQHALNKPETTPLDHDTGLGFAEKHFNPLRITSLQLWAGELGGPFTWQTASAGSTPPTTLTMSVGEIVQFRVTVFDRNGCGRWLDVGTLRVEANPDIGFVLSGNDPASLTDKGNGLFEAVSAGTLVIVARVVQDGVDIDSQTISVAVT